MPITISHSDRDEPLFQNVDFISKCKDTGLASMIFEMLSERVPLPKEAEIFELILKLSIDHGPNTPSSIPVILSAKAGETISYSVARGIEKIDDSHGGAGENAMRLFYKIKENNLKVGDVISEYVKNKIRVPGFGHRLYKSDKRAQIILKETEQIAQGSDYSKLSREIESTLEKETSKSLPINIDGALAVFLCAFGFKPELAKAVFIIARTPGLCAHYFNNKQ